jgi:beta-glucosidase
MSQVGAANYSERLLVGYRWFDAMHVRPAFCFGHGESYSKFVYQGIKVSSNAHQAFSVNFTLLNTGPVDAAEVAQLYVSFPVGAGEPLRQLKGAQKVLLPRGGSTEVVRTSHATTF